MSRTICGRIAASTLLVALVVALLVVGRGPVAVADTEQTASVLRELTAERTAISKTFLLSNGAKRLQLFEKPIHYRAADGSWQDVDTTLVGTGQVGVVRSAATQAQVTLCGQANGIPVTIASADAAVSFDLVGATEPAPVVLGDTATYLSATTATDLRYEVQPAGLKEDIVLASAAASGSYTFFVAHDGVPCQGSWRLSARNRC
jgi:hypothetical protein